MEMIFNARFGCIIMDCFTDYNWFLLYNNTGDLDGKR